MEHQIGDFKDPTIGPGSRIRKEPKKEGRIPRQMILRLLSLESLESLEQTVEHDGRPFTFAENLDVTGLQTNAVVLNHIRRQLLHKRPISALVTGQAPLMEEQSERKVVRGEESRCPHAKWAGGCRQRLGIVAKASGQRHPVPSNPFSFGHFLPGLGESRGAHPMKIKLREDACEFTGHTRGALSFGSTEEALHDRFVDQLILAGLLIRGLRKHSVRTENHRERLKPGVIPGKAAAVADELRYFREGHLGDFAVTRQASHYSETAIYKWISGIIKSVRHGEQPPSLRGKVHGYNTVAFTISVPFDSGRGRDAALDPVFGVRVDWRSVSSRMPTS